MEKNGEEKKKHLQSRAVRGFAVFLLLMCCCTFISRGIYAWLMPQVEVGNAERKSIVHQIETPGSIVAAGEKPVILPEGVQIEEVLVRPGQRVEEKTELLRLSLEDLKEKAEALEQEISVTQQRIKELQTQQKLTGQMKQKQAVRAEEDLENTARTWEMKVQQAKQRYEKAQSDLAGYQSWDSYYDMKTKQDARYQELQKDPEQAQAFAEYAQSLQYSLQKSWAESRDALQEAANEAAFALQTAENEKNLALLQARRNVEDANGETVSEKSSVMELEQKLSASKRERESYDSLIQQEGLVVSELEGSVQKVHAAAGDRTPGTAVMTLADGSEGWLFQTTLTREEMQYLNPEEPVLLKLNNGTRVLRDCAVVAMEQLEGENCRVTVETGEKKLTPGQQGTLSTSAKSALYECCVPIKAVYSGNGTDYIYVLRKKETILGTELYAVKRQVKVLEKNDTYAALEEGSLALEEQFILDADREFSQGDKVRLAERME